MAPIFFFFSPAFTKTISANALFSPLLWSLLFSSIVWASSRSTSSCRHINLPCASAVGQPLRMWFIVPSPPHKWQLSSVPYQRFLLLGVGSWSYTAFTRNLRRPSGISSISLWPILLSGTFQPSCAPGSQWSEDSYLWKADD